jgi:hypothetical protein
MSWIISQAVEGSRLGSAPSLARLRRACLPRFAGEGKRRLACGYAADGASAASPGGGTGSRDVPVAVQGSPSVKMDFKQYAVLFETAALVERSGLVI